MTGAPPIDLAAHVGAEGRQGCRVSVHTTLAGPARIDTMPVVRCGPPGASVRVETRSGWTAGVLAVGAGLSDASSRKNKSDALPARRRLLYEAPHGPGRLTAGAGVLGDFFGSMTKVTFIDASGQSRTVEAQVGSTVMETALRNAVPGIEAECGGACACATCHVYVAEEWTGKVGKPSQMEEDMLDFAFEVRPNSRLSCQIKVSEELDGLVVTTPAKQG